jgi:hypothetical protein
MVNLIQMKLIQVIRKWKSSPNKASQNCMESTSTEVTTTKMHEIGFMPGVNLIQMRPIKVMCTSKRSQNREFQHCMESKSTEAKTYENALDWIRFMPGVKVIPMR